MARVDRWIVIAGVIAAGLGLLASGAKVIAAEDRTAELRAQASGAAAPTIQVYSRETVVDVTVTDKDGKPVRGLTRDDFTVMEDKKPEPIRSFQEFNVGGPAVEKTAVKLPPHVYSNRQAAAVQGAVYIIVLDAANTGMMSQMRSREQAVKYLRQMPAGTRVALLRLGTELQFVQGFTSDPEVLIVAMMDMKNTVMTPGAVGGPPCYSRTVRTRMTLEALRQIGAMVEGIKGKKNVLWFTGPMLLDPTMHDMGCDLDTPGLDPTLDMLTASEVMVDTISPNVPCFPGEHCEYGAILLDKYIVPATGGQHFGSNDMVGSLTKAVELGSNYYSLTYVPGHGNDGFFHHITVKVNRPGLELLYRPGYGADDLAKAKAESLVPTTLSAVTPEPDKNTMRASMARFAPVAAQVVFDANVAPTTAEPRPTDAAVMGVPVAEFKDKPMVRYDIVYSIPADKIALSDGPDGLYRGAVEFDVVASDVFGKLITSVSRTMPLTLSVDEYDEFAKTPFQFLQQIDLPAGQTYLRVGVLDKVSNKVGTVEIPLMVAKGDWWSESGAVREETPWSTATNMGHPDYCGGGSRSAMSGWLNWMAHSRAVFTAESLRWSRMVGVGSGARRRIWTHSRRPERAASMRAVSPSSRVRALTSAPASMRTLRTWELPAPAACMRAVKTLPLSVEALGSTPASMKRRARSGESI